MCDSERERGRGREKVREAGGRVGGREEREGTSFRELHSALLLFTKWTAAVTSRVMTSVQFISKQYLFFLLLFLLLTTRSAPMPLAINQNMSLPLSFPPFFLSSSLLNAFHLQHSIFLQGEEEEY